MAHEWHHTPGFILGATPRAEASRLYYILTPEHGRVVALAQGVRRLESKLRSQLPVVGFASLSLVRGREFWRITDAHLLSWHTEAVRWPEAYAAIARIAGLLRRLIPGELPLTRIFLEVLAACQWLATGHWSATELVTWETVVAFRIVDALGYSADSAWRQDLGSGVGWDEQLLARAQPRHNQLVAIVNRALELSQL